MKMSSVGLFGVLILESIALAAPPAGRTVCPMRTAECSLSKKERSGFKEYKEFEFNDELSSSSASAVPAPASGAVNDHTEPKKVQRYKSVHTVVSADSIGNLPDYLQGERSVSQSNEKAGVVIVAEKITGALLPGLRSGDVLMAVLDQSIKASPSVPSPIRARVVGGKWNGAFVLGTATFDRELKRILLTFERMRLSGTDSSYVLKATGLAPSGQVGLEGEHHTQEGTYFVAEFGAAAVAGFADATTSHGQNIWGSYQTKPTPDNALKLGAAQAFSKSSERFADSARTAPEYTEIEAGREIQILIQEAPTEVSGS